LRRAPGALAVGIAALAAPVALAATTRPAPTPVSVYPTAGTTTANPSTQISFRGVSAKDLKDIRVAGSHSGNHDGRLAPHSDGHGASFLLNDPLAPAETVTVRANRRLVGQLHGVVVFKTSAPVKGLSLTPVPDAGGRPDISQHFRTEPGLLPPSIRTIRGRLGGSGGYVFTAPKIKKGQDGAMITDPGGHLVWFHRAPTGTSIYDFRAQSYRGRPVLTWWEGKILFGKGIGQGVIYDNAYRRLAIVRAGNGYRNDEHEFKLTSHGTALITIDVPVTYDLRSVGGPKRGAVYDSAIQEVDVKTGLVVFEWHATGRIPFTDSLETYKPRSKAPYDPFHVNSIDERPDGDLLVSSRNTNAAFLLSRRTGNVKWQLGGRGNSFNMGSREQFVGQHDVERHRDGTVTIFDNGAGIGEQGFRPARGLVLAVDTHKRKAKRLHALTRDEPTLSASQGNLQLLANGHYFVGWGGTTPYLSEFNHSGKLVWDATLDPGENNTYRAYRMRWTGRPARRPAVAAQRSVGGTQAWASWNGATEVARWQLLGGVSDAQVPLETVPRTGFETALSTPVGLDYVAVRALAADGSVLGTSPTIAVRSG
jgi:Arylsulfotransferase (ASST)